LRYLESSEAKDHKSDDSGKEKSLSGEGTSTEIVFK
jgi:hypothetical protein